jgi:aconitate hydratase A / 2-methylisocitrate dehydratase
MFLGRYSDVFKGDEHWQGIAVDGGETYRWNSSSTYVQNPPYFDGLRMTPEPITDIHDAKILSLFLDSITTDHISPAGSFKPSTPAGQYLVERQVAPKDFNSYGARRGNHEVMMRGTFANVRLRNQMAPGTEGGWTTHQPDNGVMTIFDAAMKYKDEAIPLLVIAGKEYGSGSSRDWAAKGTLLLGVRAVIAESFERIHRSNLVNMGVLPLQFQAGASAASLCLTGRERYDVTGIADALRPGGLVAVRAWGDNNAKPIEFQAVARIDTPEELVAFRHGGILPYVLRQLVGKQ